MPEEGGVALQRRHPRQQIAVRRPRQQGREQGVFMGAKEIDLVDRTGGFGRLRNAKRTPQDAGASGGPDRGFQSALSRFHPEQRDCDCFLSALWCRRPP